MNEQKTVKSYDWLRQIPQFLLQEDAIPLLGSPPAFPWEEFSTALKKSLAIEDFSVSYKDIQWRSEKEMLQGIANPVPLHFSVNGMGDHLTWIMSKGDIATIMARLIQDTKEFSLPDDDIFSGFYEFIALEALYTLSTLNYDRSLSIHLLEQGELPKEAALCIDVEIHCFNQVILGRLLLSSNFRKSWSERYSSTDAKSYLGLPISDQLSLTLHVEVGQMLLSRALWDKIHVGDFVLLENCWIDPEKKVGHGRILFKGIPIFGVKFTKNQIEIIEDFQFQQMKRHEGVTKTMPKAKDEDQFEEDEDFDFDESEFDDDEFDDSEFDDSEFDEGFDDEEDDDFNALDSSDSQFESPQNKREDSEIHSKESAGESTQKIATKQAADMISPDEIPLSISVEVGRFQMSVKQLIELAPGNLLELGARAENGVDLIVNGRCVARGELLRIGDTLGVRILEKI